MTKKILALLAPAIMALLAITTACSNDYKDMKPGEVRLKENDYRNDDRIQSITVAATPATEGEGTEGTEDNGTEPRHMSALELRTLWHSVVINAGKQLENKDETEKNLYAGPMEVEKAFFNHMAQGMALLQEKYPQQYQAIVEEWRRADVYAWAHYMWCAQSDEYVKLKFRATPDTDPDTTPADPGTTPMAPAE